MTITTTNDPAMVFASDDSAVILEEDDDWMHELAGNIKKCTDMRIVRDAEHDFFREMTNRYGGKVAGELLSMLWKMTV